MQSNFGNISMDDALRLAQTPAGQQLLNLIGQVNSQDLQEAMDLASAGDISGAQKTLSSLLSSPQVQALLKQLGGA